jgi:putative ABC transport system ATP-binding protein
MIAIDLKDIRKVFNAGKPYALTAVDGVSLSIEAGKVTVLRGPSGSGKTTLLSLIGCMARPSEGRIVRRSTFGFIFQQFNLVKGITALENVMLPAYPLGEPHASLKRRARELLDLFGILPRELSKAEWLSGGESQRTAIARALINDPRFIIADEPTAHLDTKLSREFMEIVARLKTSQKTVIIASHDPLVYDSPVIDRVVTMRDGKIEGPDA